MDAIIGRYRANMEELEFRLILKHPAGINFDLTPEETLGMFDFINVYKRTLLTMMQDCKYKHDTEPHLKRIILFTEDKPG